MNSLVVGGTWYDGGGRSSSVFDSFYNGFKSIFGESIVKDGRNIKPTYFNGGGLELLDSLSRHQGLNIIIWAPNISNDINIKFIERIKKNNPYALLIGSKRIDGRADDFGLPEVIDRMLVTKMNLCLLIEKNGDIFSGKIIDPLGNLFGCGTDFIKIGQQVAERAVYLSQVKRVGSSQILEIMPPQIDCDQEFFDLIHEWSAIFDKLVPRPKQTNRFLGNAAFRCSHGFPAFRGHNELIYVSRRNVDKTGIGIKDFIPVKPFEYYDGEVKYYGEVKPSVDTPVNLLIFKHFPKINYLLHGHVYIRHAPMTAKPIPCGATEEFEALMDARFGIGNSYWANLKGHGFIVGGETIERLKRDVEFYARPTLEE